MVKGTFEMSAAVDFPFCLRELFFSSEVQSGNMGKVKEGRFTKGGENCKMRLRSEAIGGVQKPLCLAGAYTFISVG